MWHHGKFTTELVVEQVGTSAKLQYTFVDADCLPSRLTSFSCAQDDQARVMAFKLAKPGGALPAALCAQHMTPQSRSGLTSL